MACKLEERWRWWCVRPRGPQATVDRDGVRGKPPLFCVIFNSCGPADKVFTDTGPFEILIQI